MVAEPAVIITRKRAVAVAVATWRSSESIKGTKNPPGAIPNIDTRKEANIDMDTTLQIPL